MRSRHLKFTLSFFICLTLIFVSGNAQDSPDEKSIEVALRMIGHQVLLSSKDSTSRVLPIIEEDGRYSIQFESEFEFEPTRLVSIIDSIASETDLASSYIVEVEQCETGAVVYSFKMDDLEQSDIIPCIGRMQPKACYTLVFTLLAGNKVESSVLPVMAENGAMGYGMLAVLFAMLCGLLLFLWNRRKTTRNDPNLIPLGEYHFDKRNTKLLINQQKIELTSKEADLLLLLYTMVNKTVEREVILNKVWGDQGDYVGRTLDVFISKLRKKLEADSNVKIANIRGVGYKLIMDV
ncbi:winged helix-turn-helix domain-containing protein [Maribacter algicola]|uniref:Winged helix-turn-helix domain-containing protein n=1 Tax=Meishania litoralis TaxID=3434685 RepID=A0ACC7LP74_9FLAO